jgi:MFS family permease
LLKAAIIMADVPRRMERTHFMLLFAATFISASGNTAMQSVLPSIGRALKIDDIFIALVFSLSALMWAIFGPYWGRKADHMDRKRLTLIGVLGYFGSKLALAIIVFAGLAHIIGPMATIICFIVFRGLYGVFGSAAPPAAQAYVADRTSVADRTASLGLLASGFGLGTIVGPAIAPLFVFAPVGLSGPLFAFAIFALLVALAVQKYLPNDRPDMTHTSRDADGSQRLSWSDPRFRRTLIFCFILGTAQAAVGQTLGFLIMDRLALPPMQALGYISTAMMAGAAATLLAQWGLIRLLNLSERQLMTIGAVLAAAGCAILAFAMSYHAIVSGFALAWLGYGLARPGVSGAASLSVGHEHQGDIAGKMTGLNGAVYIFSPALGIWLYQTNPYFLYLVMALTMALLALPWFHRNSKD